MNSLVVESAYKAFQRDGIRASDDFSGFNAVLQVAPESRIDRRARPHSENLSVASRSLLGPSRQLWLIRDASVPTFQVEQSRVTIGSVSAGIFEDFIPVRGTVSPSKSVRLRGLCAHL